MSSCYFVKYASLKRYSRWLTLPGIFAKCHCAASSQYFFTFSLIIISKRFNLCATLRFRNYHQRRRLLKVIVNVAGHSFVLALERFPLFERGLLAFIHRRPCATSPFRRGVPSQLCADNNSIYRRGLRETYHCGLEGNET